MTDTMPAPNTARRSLAALCLLAPLLSFSPGVGAQARHGSMVSVNQGIINLRSGAGTRHEVLYRLSRGYPLQVIGRHRGWLEVRDFEGDTGWVLGRLTGHRPHMVVKVSRANLRQGPGTRHRIVGRALYGEVLRTLEHRGRWVRVRRLPDGPTGWMARQLGWGW